MCVSVQREIARCADVDSDENGGHRCISHTVGSVCGSCAVVALVEVVVVVVAVVSSSHSNAYTHLYADKQARSAHKQFYSRPTQTQTARDGLVVIVSYVLVVPLVVVVVVLRDAMA